MVCLLYSAPPLAANQTFVLQNSIFEQKTKKLTDKTPAKEGVKN